MSQTFTEPTAARTDTPQPPVRVIGREELLKDDQELLVREWLVTNGLGGYACGTISGVATRRYHGLLIAAMPGPLGRRLMFSHLSERLRLPDGRLVKLSGEVRSDGELHGADFLSEFRLEMGLPVWRYEVDRHVIEKQIVVPYQQNTVYVVYRLVKGRGPLRLKLMPSVHNRSHDDPVSMPLPNSFRLAELDSRLEISTSSELPPLRMLLHSRKQAFTIERQVVPEVLYPVEERRGYDYRGALWSPGYFRLDLAEDAPATLVASTEPWEVVTALGPGEALQAEHDRRMRRLATAHPAAHRGPAAELVLAADQFIIKPVGRNIDAVRIHAQGDEVCTVIAGYHWFTDWGRDTMISLEGLTLTTGRFKEAADILRTFGYFVRDGLLPNMFPEGERDGLYHTADATMWFFHAVDRFLQYTNDRETLEQLLPKLNEIIDHHVRGTHFGIGVDPEDGLLRQGAEGYQLTWMDAKVDGWVVTPRRGKAVEINALWYNALCLMADWMRQRGSIARADELAAHARRVRDSFQRRFWYEQGGYLYDVVDGGQGDDSACRPNQVLAISCTHPVLEPERWRPVMDVVTRELLTPVGLRSLARNHPDYRAKYYGDLRTRDAAYHQGTVWVWRIGPYVDAWLKVYPEKLPEVRGLLSGFEQHLGEACVGSISEIFDAEEPFTARGCVAQAWSVAEVLRCWVKAANAMQGHVE